MVEKWMEVEEKGGGGRGGEGEKIEEDHTFLCVCDCVCVGSRMNYQLVRIRFLYSTSKARK